MQLARGISFLLQEENVAGVANADEDDLEKKIIQKKKKKKNVGVEVVQKSIFRKLRKARVSMRVIIFYLVVDDGEAL